MNDDAAGEWMDSRQTALAADAKLAGIDLELAAQTQSAVDNQPPLQTQLRTILAKHSTRVMDLFRQWDLDGNGEIDRSEFHKAVESLMPPSSELDKEDLTARLEAVDGLFDAFDADKARSRISRSVARAAAAMLSCGPASCHCTRSSALLADSHLTPTTHLLAHSLALDADQALSHAQGGAISFHELKWMLRSENKGENEKAKKKTRSRGGPGLAVIGKHPICKAAGLSRAHLLALRLYTSTLGAKINAALQDGCSSERPHPFPALVMLLSEAVSRLRKAQVKQRNHAKRVVRPAPPFDGLIT
jgi:hypothetical protein